MALGTPESRGRIVLRAELDALPLVERSDVPWRATGPYMHACGHDVHLAALVATARAIARVDGAHPVAALLQPREEGAPSGARDVVASGVLATLGACAVIGAHVQPRLDAGSVAVTSGLVNASVDEFELVVHGRVGHVGYPHTVVDPVLALAAIIMNLQQIAARRVDPVVGAVCAVTEVHAGSTTNIVPGRGAGAWVSLRLMRDEDRVGDGDALTRHRGAHRRRLRLRRDGADLIDGEPSLVQRRPTRRGGRGRRSAARVTRSSADFRSFGADDFAFYCRVVPSLMIFVGVDGPGLHDPTFVPPDDSIRSVAQRCCADTSRRSRYCRRVRAFHFLADVHEIVSGAELAARARRAEEQGYHALVIPDHLLGQLSPVVAMATVAAATSTLRVSAFVHEQRSAPSGRPRAGPGEHRRAVRRPGGRRDRRRLEQARVRRHRYARSTRRRSGRRGWPSRSPCSRGCSPVNRSASRRALHDHRLHRPARPRATTASAVLHRRRWHGAR